MPVVASQSLASQSLARRLSRYLPLALWMVFISFASTADFSSVNTSRILRPLLLWLFPDISPPLLATIHALVRKAAHFIEYFVLGMLAARAFSTSSRLPLRNHWFSWSTLLVTVYALLDEFHQSFVPSRSASIVDSLIDIAGGLTALVIYSVWTRRRLGKEANL